MVITNIAATTEDLILVQNFHLRIKAWEKFHYFWADMSSSVHINNKGKDMLILGESRSYIYTAEAIYFINFTQPNKRFLLSVHYNGSNSFLFVNTTKIYQFKAKDSLIKDYPLCLGNISKTFTINDTKKNRIKRSCKSFFCWS